MKPQGQFPCFRSGVARFYGWGTDFREPAGGSRPAGFRGRAPAVIWGQRPQKKNLNFSLMKRRKAVVRICASAVHIHALVFPVCVAQFKKKIMHSGASRVTNITRAANT